jgi:hypothetical protein
VRAGHEHDAPGREEHEHDAHELGGHEHDAHVHGGHEHLRHVPDAARPAVFAARAGVVFDPPARADQVEVAVAGFFAALSDGLADAGCTLVGHIKGTIVANEDSSGLAFHATMLGAAPALTGGFAGEVGDAVLTINVIVFGVDEAALPAVVKGAWARATPAAAAWRR